MKENKMKIIVTQYKRPNGIKKSGEVEIPDELKEKYLEIIDCNCRIVGEILLTGESAQYIEHAYGDYAVRITKRGKDAYNSLCKVIKEFDTTAFEKWLKDTTREVPKEPEIDEGLGIYSNN